MLQNKPRQLCSLMPINRLLGLCDSLLNMQRVPGRGPGWSLQLRQLPDSSSMAGRWNLCSNCWRQRIPLKTKPSAQSSLRRKCKLQLMLLMFELINKCRNRRKGYDRMGLDSVQSMLIYSEKRTLPIGMVFFSWPLNELTLGLPSCN